MYSGCRPVTRAYRKTGPAAGATSRRALVVDRRVGFRTVITGVLEREGFHVTVAETSSPVDQSLIRGQFSLLIIGDSERTTLLELALRHLSPQLAVVYLAERRRQCWRGDGGVRLLSPFTGAELTDAVSRAFRASFTKVH